MFEENISLFAFEPIGVVHSPFREKFGIPRQPGLVNVPAVIEIYEEYARAEAFRGLEDFSHIWVSFVFHAALQEKWKPTVRPPRLGGNQRVGVFASRSMFRPNPIGLSVVKLEDIEVGNEGISLKISGGDFLDKTPVLDIKPYIAYVDAISDARSGFASTAPQRRYRVEFSTQAETVLAEYADRYPGLITIIRELLALDPRPAYSDEDGRSYAMRLYEFDIKWYYQGELIQVVDIQQYESD